MGEPVYKLPNPLAPGSAALTYQQLQARATSPQSPENLFQTLISSGLLYVSPLTTKGDIFGRGSSDARVAVGSNGQFLHANSSDAEGIDWGWVPGLGLGIYGDGSDGAVTLGSDTVLTTTTHIKNYTSLNLAGYTLSGTFNTNGPNFILIHVQGTLTLGGGRITGKGLGNAGGAGGNCTQQGGDGGAGGDGAGACFVFAKTISGTGTIDAKGDNGSNGSNGIAYVAGAVGGNGGAGAATNLLFGQSGNTRNAPALGAGVNSSAGGAGGASRAGSDDEIQLKDIGAFIFSTGMTALSTSVSAKRFKNPSGSGGGAGGGSTSANGNGGGGGGASSGGWSASTPGNGGDGGNSVSAEGQGQGGGAGGGGGCGGVVVVMCETCGSGLTVSAAGGNGGNGGNGYDNGGGGGGGAAGSGGRALLFAQPSSGATVTAAAGTLGTGGQGGLNAADGANGGAGIAGLAALIVKHS